MSVLAHHKKQMEALDFASQLYTEATLMPAVHAARYHQTRLQTICIALYQELINRYADSE